jgi:hypothetical protein
VTCTSVSLGNATWAVLLVVVFMEVSFRVLVM